MPIPIEYASGLAGNALADLDKALDDAVQAKDGKARALLLHLMFSHLEEQLAAKTGSRLEDHLAGLQVWRRDGVHAVFKTSDEPCVAFAALEWDDGPGVLVLGFCYRYPVSEEAWWTNDLRPRLRLYL